MRGSAQQVVEKYLTLAREASTAGNPVMAEGYYQYAEHYYRVQNANAAAANNESSDNVGNQGGNQGGNQDGNGREQPAYEPDRPAAERPANGADGANGSAEAVVEAMPASEPDVVHAPEPAVETEPEPVVDTAPEQADDSVPTPSAEAASDRPAARRRRPRRRESAPVKEPSEQPS